MGSGTALAVVLLGYEKTFLQLAKTAFGAHEGIFYADPTMTGRVTTMIWESSYWKEPLLKAATWLRRVRFRETTREATLVRIEKEIFVGFYGIRKLLDTVKVSDSTKKQNYELVWHPNIKPVDTLNWHRFDELYDMEREGRETRDIRFLCNLFIHSFVFIVNGEDRLEGVYVASDMTKNKKLYYVPLGHILTIFRLVGRDYPANLSFERIQETGELKSRVW